MRSGSTDNPVVDFSHGREDDAGNQPHGEAARFTSFGFATLLELFEDDREAVAGLLAAALASIQADTAAIERSTPARDRYTIVEAAHRIKGTSGSIGAGRLVEISTRIEGLVNRTREPIDAATLEELRAAVDAVGTEIAQYIRSVTE